MLPLPTTMLRRRTNSPPHMHSQDGALDPQPSLSGSTNIDDLWRDAFEEYRRSLDVDLRDLSVAFLRDLEGCQNNDDILGLLQGVSDTLNRRRHGRKALRGVRKGLKSFVFGLSVILDAGAETASSLGVPGGKGIFVAVAVLVAAADRVQCSYDDLTKLLDRLHVYVERLQVRIRAPLRNESRRIAVKGLVEMLKALALATRMLRKNRIGHFLLALFTKADDVHIALETLEDVTSEEERMAIAEIAVDIEHLSAGLDYVGSSVSGLHVSLGEMRQESRLHNGELLRAMRESREANANMVNAVKMMVETSARQASDAGNTERQSLCKQLQRAISTSSPEVQDSIWRAVSVFLLSAVDFSSGTNSAPAVILSGSGPSMETIVATTCTCLLLFIAWNLTTVSRPIVRSPGSIVIVDVLGEIFVLEPESFSTWEDTHTFLLHVFKGRPGLSYVRQRNYGLGNGENQIILPDQWSQHARPGAKLRMSVIVRESGLCCPYCRTQSREVEGSLAESDKRIVCARRCHRQFGTSRRKEGAYSRTSEFDISSDRSASLDSTSRSGTLPDDARSDDNYTPEQKTGESREHSMWLFERVIVEIAAHRRRTIGGICKTDITTALREKMKKTFYEIYEALMNCTDLDGRKRCDYFRELPDRREFPDYYRIIPQPIALSHIRKRISSLTVYQSVRHLHDDVVLMFANARMYNQEHSRVYVDAVEMEKVFESVYSRVMAANPDLPGAI